MPLSYLLYTREICKGTLDFRKGCTSAPLAYPLVYLYIHNGYTMGDTQGVCIRSKWYRGTRGTKRVRAVWGTI